MIDLSNLTVGEMALIEDLGGQPVTSLGDEDRPKMKTLAAIALVIKRRTGDPTFTWNKALALPMNEVNSLLGLDEDGEVEEDSEEGKDARSDESATPSKRRSSSTSASTPTPTTD